MPYVAGCILDWFGVYPPSTPHHSFAINDFSRYGCFPPAQPSRTLTALQLDSGLQNRQRSYSFAFALAHWGDIWFHVVPVEFNLHFNILAMFFFHI